MRAITRRPIAAMGRSHRQSYSPVGAQFIQWERAMRAIRSPIAAMARSYTMNTVEPVVLRAVRSRWPSAASRSA